MPSLSNQDNRRQRHPDHCCGGGEYSKKRDQQETPGDGPETSTGQIRGVDFRGGPLLLGRVAAACYDKNARNGRTRKKQRSADDKRPTCMWIMIIPNSIAPTRPIRANTMAPIEIVHFLPVDR